MRRPRCRAGSASLATRLGRRRRPSRARSKARRRRRRRGRRRRRWHTGRRGRSARASASIGCCRRPSSRWPTSTFRRCRRTPLTLRMRTSSSLCASTCCRPPGLSTLRAPRHPMRRRAPHPQCDTLGNGGVPSILRAGRACAPCGAPRHTSNGAMCVNSVCVGLQISRICLVSALRIVGRPGRGYARAHATRSRPSGDRRPLCQVSGDS
mmetsp:Transcript_3880/g.11494  ORF Transcript_3880/g.11494 Transcript_3880/m.11494 type:complete len:209 (-) Transcript_3880:94-720(-)